jgi:hypothetical protein
LVLGQQCSLACGSKSREVVRGLSCASDLHSDELGASMLSMLFEPVRVDEPNFVIVGGLPNRFKELVGFCHIRILS